MAGDFSERARCALAAFGLTVHDDAPGAPPMNDHARRLDERLAPGRCALIVGPSGAGKSTLLRDLARRTGATDAGALLARAAKSARPEATRARSARIVDLFGGPIDGALRLLGAAGLADARVFTRRVSELSDGQRARLGIALAMSRARETIVLDEFCSGLDSATAHSLCRTLRRWLERTPAARIVCATAREEVEHWLAPAVIARVPWGGVVSIEDGAVPLPEGGVRGGFVGRETCRSCHELVRLVNPPPNPLPPGGGECGCPVIEPGTIDDYAALAPLHYRAGRPATIRRILRARDGRGGHTVGVLVTSMPTLNGSWRPRAFANRYSRGTKRERATLLNREVRCISRIIIDPRYRGRGIGSALVRAYLRNPETIATEAVAAMGAACPLFSRAGMTEWPLLPSLRDRWLTRALAELGHSAADLAETDPRTKPDPRLTRALRTWANAARSTRPLIHDPDAAARAAAHSLAGRGRAYTWTSASTHET